MVLFTYIVVEVIDMIDIGRKYFKTRREAEAFAALYDEDIYYYSEDSSSKDDYIVLMEIKEGYFDETFAEMFPYLVSYPEEDS